MTAPYGLFEQSAIAKLLASMTGGANLPPQQGLLQPPQDPVQGQMQGQMQGLLSQHLGQNPVMGEGPGLQAEQDTHAHRPGLLGKVRHLLGGDQISPEVASLLNPDQRKRLLNKGLLSQFIEGGEEKSALKMIGLEDMGKARDLQARQERLWTQIQDQSQSIQDPQARLEWVARMSAAMGLPQGEQAGLAAQRLEPARPTPQNETWGTNDALVDGKPTKIRTSNLGRVTDMAGRDISQRNIQPVPLGPSYSALPGAETEMGTVPVIDARTGKVTDTGIPVKESAGVGSAINQSARARLSAAISEMNNADAGMHEFEGRLARGEVRIGAGAQLLGRVANAFTHDNPISQLTQSGALAALNKTDPELARYIRRGMAFAEGESMISQRPSDFRTKMAAFLSTAASGASPEMIADISGRRRAILNPLNDLQANKDRKVTLSPAATTALDLVRSGKASLADVESATSLSAADKAAIKAALERPR